MLNLKRVGVIVCLLLALVACVACSGQRSIIIDTTGLTPEQIVAVEWKAKYAVALDWFDAQVISYKTSLDTFPLDKAQEIHKKVRPLLDVANTALLSFRAAAYGQDLSPASQQKAYEAFLKAKSTVLVMIVKAFQ
jgi:hypothetical protein